MKDSKPEQKEEAKGPGAPALYTDPEVLAAKVVEYFMEFLPVEEGEKVNERKVQFWETRPTITGLTLFLGFESRQSFYDYQERPGFSYAIKQARLKIESIYENMLGTKTGTVGAIFALKNMTWSDKQEIDHTSGGDKLQGPPQINVFNNAPPMAGSEDEIKE